MAANAESPPPPLPQVWSTPDNFCHTSEDNCYTCGMKLWCAKPHPLLAGNKVCARDSRIRSYCWDAYGTGMCAMHTLDDCATACRSTPECELFTYFPSEMEGSCMLCRDMCAQRPLGPQRTAPAC